MVLGLWRAKWGLLRLALAAFVLWIFATDTGARLARMQLAALPGFNYLGELESLRAQGRYGEALMVADAGLDELGGEDRARLAAERERTVAEQQSWIHKAKEAGLGALSGQGDSLEALVGAMAADFFIVGDLRDLIIQGGKQLLDGDSDEVVLLLSVVGVLTTLAPEVDWVPSVLKAAKKAGAMSVHMAEYIKSAIKAKRTTELEKLFGDVQKLARKASPGGAMRLMRFAENPKDVERLAMFVEKSGAGAFALHVTGKEGADLLKAGESAEDLVIKASKKGRAGTNFLRSPAARTLMRPHLVVGLLKGIWKGNAAKLVSRALERLDPSAWWLVPLLAGWVVVEIGLLMGKLRGRSASEEQQAGHAQSTYRPAA
jgi:hypothetical protein